MTGQAEMFAKPRKHSELPGDGYAGTPGLGPTGESCGTCGNRKTRSSVSTSWNKCALVKRHWDRKTDIRLDAPACIHWVKANAPIQPGTCDAKRSKDLGLESVVRTQSGDGA